jgi:hypothetical protein
MRCPRVLAVLVLGLAFQAAGALAQSPAPQPPSPQSPAPQSPPAPPPTPSTGGLLNEASTLARTYVDSLDNGDLIPARGRVPDCLTPQQKAELDQRFREWEIDYKRAYDAAQSYVLTRLAYDGQVQLVDDAARAEVSAMMNVGDAKPGQEAAAKKAWDDAKAEHARMVHGLSEVTRALANDTADLRDRVELLRYARAAYGKALAALPKDACPPPPKTSTGMVPPKGEPPAHARLERAVLDEINLARAQPAEYARTMPHTVAGDEARSFLEHQATLPALELNPLLAAAAAGHVADQGPRGGSSHTGSDGSSPMQRMQNGGVWSTIYAEEIAVNANDASAIVRQLIIDLGVAGHPHRGDLFSANLKFAGVACGPNSATKTMCVIDLTAAPPAR